MSRQQPPTGLETLGLAAGAVAHDFDNALMAIINHAALIRARSNDPEVTSHAEAILRVARGAGRVVERVRGLVRPGEAPPRERLDIHTLVAEAMDLASTRAGIASIQITIADQSESFAIGGDAAELTQALANLLHNAIDAAQTSVVIHTTATGIIRIRDDGPGIPQAVRHRIFEPYFSTRPAGTGLGLPSALHAVTQHGGTLQLQNVDPGTQVTITLPVLGSGADIAEPRPITDLDLNKSHLNARVLIIDDSRDTRDALAILFEAAGFNALSAHDEASALTLFHTEQIELVVTDLRLGDQLAYGLIDRLAALRPGIPIVVVTGLTQPERPAKLKRVAAAVFEKPFSPARLLEIARRLITERDTLAKLRSSP